jgi:hypothetical protein
MSFDEFGGYPDRVRVRVIVSPDVERVVEDEFLPDGIAVARLRCGSPIGYRLDRALLTQAPALATYAGLRSSMS